MKLGDGDLGGCRGGECGIDWVREDGFGVWESLPRSEWSHGYTHVKQHHAVNLRSVHVTHLTVSIKTLSVIT